MPRTYPDLATFFREEGRTQDDVAHDLGISPALLSMYKWKLRQPPLQLALRITSLCRVPLESLLRAPRPTPAKAARRSQTVTSRPRQMTGNSGNHPSLHNTNPRAAGASRQATMESSQSEKTSKTGSFTRSKH